MLKKPCVCSRGHISSPITMKHGQKFFLDEISDEYKNGSCLVKTWLLGQILEKPCVCTTDQIFGLILMKLLKMVHVRSQCRSQAQIIEDPMLVTKGCDLNPCSLMLYQTIQKAQVSDSRAIMVLLFLVSNRNGAKECLTKVCKNLCLDDIFDETRNLLHWCVNLIHWDKLIETTIWLWCSTNWFRLFFFIL